MKLCCMWQIATYHQRIYDQIRTTSGCADTRVDKYEIENFPACLILLKDWLMGFSWFVLSAHIFILSFMLEHSRFVVWHSASSSSPSHFAPSRWYFHFKLSSDFFFQLLSVSYELARSLSAETLASNPNGMYVGWVYINMIKLSVSLAGTLLTCFKEKDILKIYVY